MQACRALNSQTTRRGAVYAGRIVSTASMFEGHEVLPYAKDTMDLLISMLERVLVYYSIMTNVMSKDLRKC